MTPVPHDPWRPHVPGYPARTSVADEQAPGGTDYRERLSAPLADGMTVDDLAGWIDDPGRDREVAYWQAWDAAVAVSMVAG